MEVERLTAVLEASGLGGFTSSMAAADRAVAGPKDQLRALAEVSKIATEALQRVKVTASQAAESRVSAEAIISGVRGISEEARTAARELDHVKLTQTQAAETRLVAAEQVRSLKDVEHQALRTRAATSGAGGGGPGMFGFGRGILLPAAIGAGALAAPAMGPGAVGLLAMVPALASTGVGAIGTLYAALHGLGPALQGNKQAFDQLNASQQAFVQTLRSLNTGLTKVASNALLPGLTKALHEMFTPTLMAALTRAVDEFGRAIGDAGQMFGKYFGSQQFAALMGPLATAGANGIRDLARAALSFADAMGVLARAAIPLTNWMGDAVVKASALFDSWLRAKDATGQLSRSLTGTETSLRLVGQLVESLWHVIESLGAALYPVSTVALKDLVDGLNYLAGVIERNKQTIQEIVGGALAALVQTLKILLPIVAALFKALNNIAKAIGGWKVAFEIVIGGMLAAKFVTLATAIRGVATSLGLVGTEASASMAKIGTLAGALGKVAAFSFGSGQDVVAKQGGYVRNTKTGQVLPLIGNTVPAGWVRVSGPGGGGTGGLTSEHGGGMGAGTGSLYTPLYGAALKSYIAKQAQALGLDPLAALAVASAEGGFSGTIGDNGTSFGPFQLHKGGALPKGQGAGFAQSRSGIDYALRQMAQHAGGLQGMDAVRAIVTQFERPQDGGKGDLARAAAYLAGHGGASMAAQQSPFGAPPPFTKGLGGAPSVIPAQATGFANVASTYANLAKQLSNTGSTAKAYLDDELIALTKEWAVLSQKAAASTGKNKTALDKAVTGIENKMRDVGTLIANAIIVTGDALLPAKLKTQLATATAQFKADSEYAKSLTGLYADDYAKTLLGDLQDQQSILGREVTSLQSKLTGATGKQRTAIQTELTKIQGELTNVQGQIVTSLQQAVSVLQGQVTTAFGNVQSELMAQLATKYFQGGAKTPLEQQLANMQAQDQLASLKDSIQQAQDQLAQDQAGALTKVVFDAATGSITNVYSAAGLKAIEADKKALAAAQRQLDEYNLSIDALAERTRMDQAYAVAQKGLTADLARLQVQFENGKGSMAALDAVARKYGLTMSTVATPSIDDLAKKSGELKQAFQDLIDYISKVTGKTPAVTTTPGGGTGGGAAVTSKVTLPGGISVPAGVIGGGFGGGFGSPYQPPSLSGAAGYFMLNPVTGLPHSIPKYADGGPTGKGGLSMLHDGEYVVPKGGALVGGRGGGVNVTLNVQALDPSSVNWDNIAADIHMALVRRARRNGNNLWAAGGIK